MIEDVAMFLLIVSAVAGLFIGTVLFGWLYGEDEIPEELRDSFYGDD
jgi:hypothetical protein